MTGQLSPDATPGLDPGNARTESAGREAFGRRSGLATCSCRRNPSSVVGWLIVTSAARRRSSGSRGVWWWGSSVRRFPRSAPGSGDGPAARSPHPRGVGEPSPRRGCRARPHRRAATAGEAARHHQTAPTAGRLRAVHPRDRTGPHGSRSPADAQGPPDLWRFPPSTAARRPSVRAAERRQCGSPPRSPAALLRRLGRPRRDAAAAPGRPAGSRPQRVACAGDRCADHSQRRSRPSRGSACPPPRKITRRRSVAGRRYSPHSWSDSLHVALAGGQVNRDGRSPVSSTAA